MSDMNNPGNAQASESSTDTMPEDAAELFGMGDAIQDELVKQINEQKAENAELKDKLLRTLAEIENVRRRSQREVEDAGRFAITGFARNLLSVADNLRRALSAVPGEQRDGTPLIKALCDGVEATERELLRVLDNAGVKAIKADGEIFDPNLHEVMFEMPGGDKPAGTIMQVIEPGYTINDRLLRPARVGVAKAG